MNLPIDQLLCGDAVELSREKLPDDSIDGIATDPPYGLEFMGEEWDKFGGKPNPKGEYNGEGGMERYFKGNKLIYSWSSSELLNYQLWTTSWATEALRVLKPGASMLVMGGTRTYHRMVCGVEDAGFLVKDCLAWCYNSGFPKAQDLGKMIDKRKQAYLFFNEIRKLLKNHFEKSGKSLKEINQAFDFATTGSGMAGHWFANITQQTLPTKSQWLKLKELLNIPDNKFDDTYREVEPDKRPVIGKDKNWGRASDSLGIGGKNWDVTLPYSDLAKKWDGWKVGGLKPAYEPILWAVKPPEGSYIDNVLKHGVGAVNVDGCRIPFESEEDIHGKNPHTIHKEEANYGIYHPYSNKQFDVNEQGRYPANMIRTDRFHDGYDRFYFIPKASRGERWFKCKVCAVCQDGTHRGDHDDHALHCHDCGVDFPNTEEGRETHKNHRTESNIIAHPTVKPVSLGEHLIKLVTREGQIVVDFFCGLGSFSVAARHQNRHYIGFDNNPDYIEIARHRLTAIPRPLEAY